MAKTDVDDFGFRTGNRLDIIADALRVRVNRSRSLSVYQGVYQGYR